MYTLWPDSGCAHTSNHAAREVVPPVHPVPPDLRSARSAPQVLSSVPFRPRTPHGWQELKRKLEAAEDSDIVEQGKATLKSVKKELRLLQKAEEEHDQGESARSSPL